MKSTAPEGKMGPIRLTYRETGSYTEVTFRRLGRSALRSAREVPDGSPERNGRT